MLVWLTKIKAIDPETGELKTWSGPKITAFTFKEAQEICKEIGYCEIDGLFIGEADRNEIEFIFDHDTTSFGLN